MTTRQLGRRTTRHLLNDSDGEAELRGRESLRRPSDNVRARERPDVNQAPVFVSGITRMVPEDAGDGGKVGGPVRATDPDGDALSYTITGGADMDAFEITAANRSSGQITVKKGTTELDFEGPKTTYEVEVTADDPFGLSASTMVTIMVTDVNEPPEVMLIVDGTPPAPDAVVVTGYSTVDYEENDTGAVATYTSSVAGVAWSLSGSDRDDFTISGGVLEFTSPPDYEVPTDANTDNKYMVTVTATDGTTTGTVSVTVSVTDLDEETTNGNGEFDPLSYDADDSGKRDDRPA